MHLVRITTKQTMDSIFGIGTPELILILLIAAIVMGPARIGAAARWLGKTTAQLQKISRGFMRQLNAELATVDETGELKEALKEVQNLRQQVADIRNEITATTTGALTESKQILQSTRNEFQNTIKPPTLTPTEENGLILPDVPPPTLPNRVDITDDSD